MGSNSFWISPWLIIIIIIIILYGNSLKNFLNTIRIEKITHGKTAIFLNKSQNIKTIEYAAQLRKLGKYPPDKIEDIVEDLRARALVSEEYKKLPNTNSKIDYLSKKFATAALNYTLERFHSTLFGSQIQILEYLNSRASSTVDELMNFYNRAKLQYPDYFKDYSFNQYMSFLENSQLIKKEENKYSITGLGYAYLMYRVETNRTVLPLF